MSHACSPCGGGAFALGGAASRHCLSRPEALCEAFSFQASGKASDLTVATPYYIVDPTVASTYPSQGVLGSTATAVAGKALGAEEGLFDAHGNPIDKNARDRGV